MFVRRGANVQGPVPLQRVVALLKAGTLKPTDELATAASGPWVPLRQAVHLPAADLLVVERFTIKRGVFGAYVAHYSCPKCADALQSDEGEMSQVETCPTCGIQYRLAARATQEVGAAKLEQDRQRAERAAAAVRDRERRSAERQEAEARREEERRLQSEAQRVQDSEAEHAERLRIDRAALARARPGSCWYCGQADVGRWPQCPGCRMLSGAPGSRRGAG